MAVTHGDMGNQGGLEDEDTLSYRELLRLTASDVEG